MRKSDKKRPLINPQLWDIIAVFIVFFSPYVFNLFFQGTIQSHFCGITSALSVSDWASFWITFISMLVTAKLASLTFNLSKRIENNQDMRQMEEDRLKFVILKVSSKNDRTFEIVMTKDIISVNEVRVESVAMNFGDATSIELKPFNVTDTDHNMLKGCRFMVEIPCESENNKAFLLWKRQMYNRREQFFIAELDVKIEYRFLSARKKQAIKHLHSVADIAVEMDDENNLQYKVINTGVSFINDYN